MKKIFLNIFIFFFLSSTLNIYPQGYIRNIYIERKNVFDSTQKDWFFAAKLANSLRVVTRQYVIEDELLFSPNDEIDIELIEETERNLRNTGLFTSVKIELDSVGNDLFDIYLTTQDRWSTRPSLLFGTGGGAQNIGGRLEELNFLGTATYLTLEGLYRTENNTGWQGYTAISQKRLFRSEYGFEAGLFANKYTTTQFLGLNKPFRTLDTKSSFGVFGNNSFGNEFLFKPDSSYELMFYHSRSISGWYSRAWRDIDRVFFTAYLQLEDIDRGRPEFKRAYDNSGKFLIAFSSISEDYVKSTKLNNYLIEDFSIGGWGTAILGRTFSLGGKGESYYYIAGQGEQSYFDGKLYLWGQLTGASAFAQSRGLNTYQEFSGQAFYRAYDWLLLATRIRQQTVWNWYGLRQLILDNSTGLRGFPVNQITGDNRIIGNIEARLFPDIRFWIFNTGLVLFYDFGTAWRQNTEITKTQWKNSIGFGLRVYDMKSTGSHGIYRIDFAYNLTDKKFGEIIFTSGQLFSAIKSHIFKLPQIFGLEFDSD
ncbi:MAG: hypothetical protein N2319_03345 [Candidatus Kapabacteria bacterium]|nr:hypothetical protein [Candidatus Kapabacteria bacterium]